jgi:hypothetical protein
MDPGMMGMPVGMPAMPSSPQFDPGSLSTDPVGTRVNAVATLIGRQNPGLDEPTVRRVARKVVGRLITGAWGWEPLHEHIEDPHAHGNAIPRLIRPPAPRRKPGTQVPSEYSVFRRKDPEALGVPHGPHQQGPVRQPSPQADPDPWDEALHRPARPDTWDEPKRPLPGEREEGAAPVIPDLSEFDQPAGVAEVRRKFRDLREELGLPHGEEGLGSTGSRSSLPFTLGDWGWKPEEEAPEDPKAENAQDDGSGGQDKGDKGGSSLPGMPKMPKIPGMGGEAGGEAGAAAGGGEAAGGAAAVEELAPLLLV